MPDPANRKAVAKLRVPELTCGLDENCGLDTIIQNSRWTEHSLKRNRDRTPDDRVVSPCCEPPAHPPGRQARASTRRRALGR
jgi:hypothetical protein